MTAENLYHSTAAERWAWFLTNADKLTQEEVRSLFPDEEFSEAAGVLEMISRTPEQLMAYSARLKFQRDESRKDPSGQTGRRSERPTGRRRNW